MGSQMAVSARVPSFYRNRDLICASVILNGRVRTVVGPLSWPVKIQKWIARPVYRGYHKDWRVRLLAFTKIYRVYLARFAGSNT